MQCSYAQSAGAPLWARFAPLLARAQLAENFQEFEQFELLPPIPEIRVRKVAAVVKRKLRVDFFAGGGGASHAMHWAFGDQPDFCVNHDADALNMHRMNHPDTMHLNDDVYDVDPYEVTNNQPVGLFHASPDCTHHSQAKGGQPRERAIRSLPWVVAKWAGTVKPDVITFENVKQIVQWSPLVAKRDKKTGRVIKLNKTVAAPGERVPLRQQYLIPDRKREGECWKFFVDELRRMGYKVEWRNLRACDFGAGTSRSRLFMVARRDGKPIRWPKPTHGNGPGLKPFVTAADSIDWSIPCPSIFLRHKPLANATHRRIARGIQLYVVKSKRPFIVPITHTGSVRVHSIDDPLRTITTANGGEFTLCMPTLAAHTLIQTSYGERKGQAPRVPHIDKPLGTVVGTIKHRVVAAHMIKFRGDSAGTSANDPLPTITAGGAMKRPAGAAHALGVVETQLGIYDEGTPPPSQTATLRAPLMCHAYSSNTAGGRGDVRLPMKTITTGGHHALVECKLAKEVEDAALRIAKFMVQYGGSKYKPEEVDTLTTEQLLEVVSVYVEGVRYLIIDIGLRMLTPRELFNAQGFPKSYRIDKGADGKILTKSVAVRLVGNSVSPHPYRALLKANFDGEEEYEALAA
jgi:DNA (cytosine-5)-methyltransferase 1